MALVSLFSGVAQWEASQLEAETASVEYKIRLCSASVVMPWVSVSD